MTMALYATRDIMGSPMGEWFEHNAPAPSCRVPEKKRPPDGGLKPETRTLSVTERSRRPRGWREAEHLGRSPPAGCSRRPQAARRETDRPLRRVCNRERPSHD